MCYANVNGVSQDAARAVQWYTRAAEAGDAEAQCFLGMCYYSGAGIPKDMALAMHWYTRAAEAGLAEAKDALAELFRTYIST